MLILFSSFRQVSSLSDSEVASTEATEKIFYTPQNRSNKNKKNDADTGLPPFLATATTFLQKIAKDSYADEVPPVSKLVEKRFEAPVSKPFDKAELFANSIICDLRKFDDEHFAMVKMIITKDIYEVLMKQKTQA